jgi:hypothetical protein
MHSDGHLILYGFSVALDCEYGCERIRRACRQSQKSHAKFLLLELDGLTGRVHFGREDFLFKAAKSQCFARPKVGVDKQSVALTREIREGGVLHLTGIGFMDKASMGIHPLANACQDLY